MRVQLRSDHGAVAVIVAILVVVLVGMAAFVADFGSAYVTKRQLSTGADAASLAGAAALTTFTGSCASIAADPTAVAAARAAADSYMARNRPGYDNVGFSVTCDGKSLLVSYAAHKKVQSLFGGVFGSSGTDTTRSATASIGVPPDLTGLRPYLLCNSDLNNLVLGVPRQFDFPSTDTACGKPNGNWYTLDCPEDGQGNSTTVLAHNTYYGCDSDIFRIDTTTAGGVPAAIVTLLDNTCTAAEAAQGTPLTAKPGCLTGNTGNLASQNIEKAWRYLTGLADINGVDLATPVQPKSIVLPVFYPDSWYQSGNNTVYPVYNFVGATVCGYHWNNDSHSGVSNLGACAGAAFVPPGNNGNFDAIILAGAHVLNGDSSGPPSCAIGAPCDLGVRAVRLVQ